MEHKKEITMLHEVVNTYKEENEKLKKKIEELEDGENTLNMIDKLNKEFDELQEENEKNKEKVIFLEALAINFKERSELMFEKNMTCMSYYRKFIEKMEELTQGAFYAANGSDLQVAIRDQGRFNFDLLRIMNSPDSDDDDDS